MIDINKDLVTLLSDLISIESETGDEKKLCDTLFSTLSSLDGELVREKNSLVYNLNLNKDKTVALVGHIDTVPVAESSTKAVIKAGELWGRGACDMKSGIALMLKVINDVSAGSFNPKYNLSFVFYEGEEGPIPNGINFLDKANLLKGIDFAYILEPTEGRYSVGCLGAIAVKKEIKGIAAHSATSKKGNSALNETFEIFNRVRRMDEEISEIAYIDGLSYYETVNITTMETYNRAFNVIPGEADITVNYRFAPDKKLEVAMNELLDVFGVEGNSVLDSADSCYIGSLGDDFLLEDVEREIMQAWTDMAQLNAAGIPAINFGPGSITVAHKKDERINIEELKDFYTLLLKHL